MSRRITMTRPDPGTRPPAFFINDLGGCIGRWWWMNTVQPPTCWLNTSYPFPLWGSNHWYRQRTKS